MLNTDLLTAARDAGHIPISPAISRVLLLGCLLVCEVIQDL